MFKLTRVPHHWVHQIIYFCDHQVYPFVLEDELGRDCKKKRTKDQEKFEEEAEQALEGDDKKTSLRL